MRIPDEPASQPIGINIVPLIDIIFCILVFFVLASLVLTRSEALDVNLPGASTAETKITPAVTVSITSDGKIAVNRETVELDGVVPAIEKILAEKPEAERDSGLVVLNADLGITHGKVVDVMNELRQLPDVKLAIAAQRNSEESE
jgi:biopolymer transport protein ExbD